MRTNGDEMNGSDSQVIARLLRVVEADKSLNESIYSTPAELMEERESAIDAVTEADLKRARKLAGRL